MDIIGLQGCRNRLVQLSFSDGEMIDALLLGVDPDEHDDLTFEVRRVVRPGDPHSVGSAVGATLVAPLADLVGWRAL